MLRLPIRLWTTPECFSVRPVAAGPSGSGRPRITLSPTETIDPRPDQGLTPVEMAHARTELAPQGRAPRISTTIEESGSFAPPARWRVPALGAAGAALLGVIAWAMLSDGTGHNALAAPGTNAAPTAAPTTSTNNAPPAGPMQAATTTPIAPMAAAAAGAGAAPIAPIANPSDPAALPSAATLAQAVTPPSAQPAEQAAAPDKTDDDDKGSSSSTRGKRGGRGKKGAGVTSEAPPSPSGASASAAERQARATIRVKVFPWGRVWIDGKVRGSVPPILEVQVAPGPHEIAVGHEKPMDTRKVNVAPGASELVSFDLEGK